MTDPWSALEIPRTAMTPSAMEPAQAVFGLAATITNEATRRSPTDEGVLQAGHLITNAGLRMAWIEAGYRLTVVGKDPNHAVMAALDVNDYELISAGASLAVREGMTVLDLSAAACWRWEHPAQPSGGRQKDLRSAAAEGISEPRLRSWLAGAQADDDVRVLERYRHEITHRAPSRGVTIDIGAGLLSPPTFSGVRVDEIARFAAAVASRWFIGLLEGVRSVVAAMPPTPPDTAR